MTTLQRPNAVVPWQWFVATGALAGALALAGPWAAGAIIVAVAGVAWILAGGLEVGLRLMPPALAVFAVTFAPTVLSERFGAPSVMKYVLPLVAVWGVLRTRREATSARDLPETLLVITLFPMAAALSTFAAVDMALAGDNMIETVGTSMLAVVLVLWVRSTESLRMLAYGILGGTTFLAVVNGFQGLTSDFGNTYFGFAVSNAPEAAPDEAVRIGGPFDDGNYLSQVLLIGLPIAVWLVVHGRRTATRVLGGAAAVSMVVSIALSYSRGGLLAFGAVVVLASLISRRRTLWISVAIAGAVLAALFAPATIIDRATSIAGSLSVRADQIVIEDASTRGRLNEMGSAILMWRDSPAVGVGVGNYEALYLDYSSLLGLDPRRSGRSAHSLYLETLAETGVVGLAALLITVTAGLVTLWRARRRLSADGDRRTSDLALALWLGLVGYLLAAVFLHDAFEDPLWLLVGTSMATAGMAVGSGRDTRPMRLVHVIENDTPPETRRQIASLVENPSTVGMADHRSLIVDPPAAPDPSVADRFTRYWSTFQRIRLSHADVVHVHDRQLGRPGIVAGIVLGIPVVLTDDGPPPGPVRRLLDWFSLDRVIRSGLGQAQPAGLAQVATESIPDALEEPTTTAAAAARIGALLGNRGGPVVMLAADGGESATATAAGAVRSLFATYPDATVLLVDDGPSWDDGFAWPADRVLRIAAGEVGAAFANAHLFVDVSVETPRLDLVGAALAAGLAVVVTDHEETERMVENDYAITIPAADSSILANALHFALSNPSGLLRRGALARSRTLARFGSVAWSETVHGVYRDVADGRSIEWRP